MGLIKKGTYLVLLTGKENDQFKHGYVFKQAKTHIHISVEKDLNGEPNGWSHYPATVDAEYAHYEGTWREATDHEVIMYNLDNKPVCSDISLIEYLKSTNRPVFELPRA